MPTSLNLPTKASIFGEPIFFASFLHSIATLTGYPATLLVSSMSISRFLEPPPTGSRNSRRCTLTFGLPCIFSTISSTSFPLAAEEDGSFLPGRFFLADRLLLALDILADHASQTPPHLSRPSLRHTRLLTPISAAESASATTSARRPFLKGLGLAGASGTLALSITVAVMTAAAATERDSEASDGPFGHGAALDGDGHRLGELLESFGRGG